MSSNTSVTGASPLTFAKAELLRSGKISAAPAASLRSADGCSVDVVSFLLAGLCASPLAAPHLGERSNITPMQVLGTYRTIRRSLDSPQGHRYIKRSLRSLVIVECGSIFSKRSLNLSTLSIYVVPLLRAVRSRRQKQHVTRRGRVLSIISRSIDTLCGPSRKGS